MKVAVYLGSNQGSHSIYAEKVKELGTMIGSHGHTLVFGGSCAGTMGILADSVKRSGGKVIGVIPTFLLYRKQENMDETYVVKTMAERKNKMIELADCFIALPGGPGTLEEISEIISGVKLGLIQKPYAFINVNGYYEGLKAFFNHMVEEDFMKKEERNQILFFENLAELEKALGLGKQSEAGVEGGNSCTPAS